MMTDEPTIMSSGYNSYSTWLNFADEIDDYAREMSEKIESARRDYDSQKDADTEETIFDCDAGSAKSKK